MNQTDLRETGISSDAGKTAVIVITVIFSCLFFTLGFFVGKAGSPPKIEQVVPSPPVSLAPAVPAPAVTGVQAAPQPLPEPQSDKAAPASSARTLEPANSPQPAARPQPEIKSAPAASPVREMPAKAVSETLKPAAKPQPAETAPAKEEVSAPLYAVQMGAFKSRSEADRCRSKYAKKGYKIYISVVKAERHLKVYKVKTGEFRERKDAELLAVKLKKLEGLHAFVTNVRE